MTYYQEYDKIIVVGTGIAGLTAAYRLQEAGHSVAVLEENNYPGGRMFTTQWKGFQIDPAAKFVTGADEYILKLVDEEIALDALKALKKSWEKQRINPSILIPVDASEQSPRERVHPLGFEVPLSNLNLLNLHQRVVEALNDYWHCTGDRHEAYQKFDHLQREYLTTIAAFGGIFNKAKSVAATGESASLGTLKLLAHLPATVQHWLDTVLTEVDVLNDLTKGNEVFSNVGAVVPTSTLTRFLSAKDDNEKKDLVWGITKYMRLPMCQDLQ
jgi:hypothetical protein